MHCYPRDISKLRSLSHLCDDFAALDALVTELMDQEPSHLVSPSAIASSPSSSSSSSSSSAIVSPLLSAAEVTTNGNSKTSSKKKHLAGDVGGNSCSKEDFQLPFGWSVKEKKSSRNKLYINPEGNKQFNSLLGVERHVNGESNATDWTYVNKQVVPCPRCVPGSGRMAGHGGHHITFALPDDWQVDETTNPKSFINPDGDKRFKNLLAVERYINGESNARDWTHVNKVGPCPRCISGSGKMTGHEGSHITFALPDDWQVDENYNKIKRFYINPNGDKRFHSLLGVERYINGESNARDWTNIKKNWSLMDTHQQGYMNKQVGSCPCESCNVEIPSFSSSSSSSTTSNEQTTKSKKKRNAPTSSAVSQGNQEIKKRKKSHGILSSSGSSDSKEDEKEDADMLLDDQDDDDENDEEVFVSSVHDICDSGITELNNKEDKDGIRRDQDLLTSTRKSSVLRQVPSTSSAQKTVVDDEEASSSDEEEEEEGGDYLDQITTLSGLRDAAGTLNLNKAKSNYKADDLDELRTAIRIAMARLCLTCRDAVFKRWCELEQNRKKGSSSKSNIAGTCRKQYQGLTDDQKNDSNGMNFHHALQNSTLSINLQHGIRFANANRLLISTTKTNTITHKNSLAAPSKTNISNCIQVLNGDVVKNKGRQIITNIWRSMYACFQEYQHLFQGRLPTSDEMTGNYTSGSVYELEEEQQRFMGGKAIWSLHDKTHGGKHVKSMLTDDYLSNGREAKYNKLRHAPKSIKGGKPTLYLCDTTTGSVMTGDYVDNANSTHAWTSGDIDYQKPGDCHPHQDWLDSEAAVVAASISMNGMRLLVQIVFRVPGSGNAAIAMAILRQHWLGDHIDPISSGSVSKVTSSSSSSSYVPE